MRGRALLRQLQAERQRREADETALGKAAWIEHCAAGLMLQALSEAAPAPVAEPPPPAPEPPEQAEPQPAAASEADQYAVIYPQRAALIRRLRGLPPKCDFGPPPPELLHAIIAGTSPILRALDSSAELEAAAAG